MVTSPGYPPVWLGHPLHPVLTDVTIGCWTSALVLDLVGGRSGARAAQRLIGLGILSAVPTVASGAADWSRLDRGDQRIGLIHAAANSTAIALYGWSWLARRRGHHLRGIGISVAGVAAVTVGGYLGGHLTYRRSVGTNRTVDIAAPAEWTDTSSGASSQPDVDVVTLDGADILVDTPTGDGIAGRCSHAGGPLAEGELERDGAGACVTCPWHGSRFRFADGSVVHGPATSPQPTFATRRVEGGWQVRSPGSAYVPWQRPTASVL